MPTLDDLTTQQPVCRLSLDEIVNSVADLNSPPVVACKLMELYECDAPSQEIVDILRLDPALTTKILKVCNSVHYGRSQEIGSLQDALSLLGLGEILRTVWRLSLGRKFQHPLNLYGMPEDGLWRHSVTAAVAAQELNRICPHPPAKDAIVFTAALLHDIGKLALNDVLLPELPTVQRLLSETDESIVDIEKRLCRISHAKLGGTVLHKWNLPKWLADAVQQHHDPPIEEPNLAAVVHLANCCSHLIGASFGYSSLSTCMITDSITALGLEWQAIETTIIKVQERWQEIERFVSPDG